jgi:hypothetical protein
MDRDSIKHFQVGYYLSHAATLVSVIVCIREYKQSPR